MGKRIVAAFDHVRAGAKAVAEVVGVPADATITQIANGVRKIGEGIGVLNPSLADAQAAAEQRRADLVAAQADVTSAEAELDRLHDAGAEPKDITSAEARVADARLTAERAQRAYASAERRLAVTNDADASGVRESMIVRRDAAKVIRAEAAAELDRLAPLVAAAIASIDSQDDVLREGQRAGVVAQDGVYFRRGHLAAEHALVKAGVIPKPGDSHPGAVDFIRHGNDVLTSTII